MHFITLQEFAIFLYYLSSIWIIYVARMPPLLTRQAETDTAERRRAFSYSHQKFSSQEMGLVISNGENSFGLESVCGSVGLLHVEF